MKRHLYRTLLVYGVLLLGLVYVYPTMGWMTLSDAQRAERLERWKKEDQKVERLGYWATVAKKASRWAEFDRDWVINLGLDLQGGVQMVVGVDYNALDPKVKDRLINEQKMTEAAIKKEMQQQVLQRIERRLRGFGASEPIVQTMGDDQIQVQVPGEKDIERIRNLIFIRSFLTFHIVAGEDEMVKIISDIDKHFKNDFVPRLERSALREEQGLLAVKDGMFERVQEIVKEAATVPGLIPDDKMIAFSKDPLPGEPQKHFIYVLNKEPLMTGDNLTQAGARPDENTGGSKWMILFNLNAAAGREFGERTQANIDKPMAIVVDNVVLSAPTIRDRITTSGQITGNFSQDEAVGLAINLNAGSLPVPVREDQAGLVGPSLGADSINKGVESSIVGLIIVCIFMIVYYRVAGLVANIALFMNALLLLGCMAYIQATLTLPGIAGVILTLGMAVDANVLIYERMREEIRNGKSLLACIEGGYAHAMNAIVDSNVTTLIAGVVLIQFGSGPVKGFAITLCIGIASSMFTALVVTRAVFDFLASKKWLTKVYFMHLIPSDTNVPFMKWRRPLMIASVVAIVGGLGLFFARGDKMYGVEFTTGTNVIASLKADSPISAENVRAELTGSGFVEPTVTAYEQIGNEKANRFMIHLGEVAKGATVGAEQTGQAEQTDQSKTEQSATPDNSIASRVQESLGKLAGAADKVEIEKIDMVGPTVGRQLKVDAFKAIAWASIFLLIYLWFRFELRFSVAALVATAHDVAFTLGLFALTGRQVSLGVVAAILTIIGYSMNDTVIVFDRIREDLKLYRGRGMTLLEIMNKSVNQTLSRTLITSTLTLFVVIVLLFRGGATINDFAFALALGIIIGTYSSIFIASPTVYYWERLVARFEARKGTDNDDNTPSRRRRKSTKPAVEDGATTV
ncbi:MAG: protein translocase subunit SecD [Candidatus Hydrogenedentes bacterium]|nr:protein translocase subunit SecD [Candidatus Hydrogenedentota bacterium]